MKMTKNENLFREIVYKCEMNGPNRAQQMNGPNRAQQMNGPRARAQQGPIYDRILIGCFI